MQQAVKDAWVAALRSGEYTQGRHALYDPNTGHCCLGVLCELALKEGIVYKEEAPSGTTAFMTVGSHYLDDESCVTLPHSVMRWAGLDSVSPLVIADGTPLKLTTLNDTGTPFVEIAKYIEESL